ncbi:MAG: response regulator [Elusimicrobia bacterium]|nr:response regulator [Elusimicrobiota bacterium]
MKPHGWPAGAAVLVVDDDPEVLRVACRFLETAGFRVVGASSRQEAEARASAGLALAVVDIDLGAEDGGDVVARLRERCPGIQVLFISGRSGQPCDGAAFLPKPFTRQALLDAVAELLASAR